MMACDSALVEGGVEEELFFDAREDLSCGSDSIPDLSLNYGSWVLPDFDYDVWSKNPESIRVRRRRFRREMDLSSCSSSKCGSFDTGEVEENICISADDRGMPSDSSVEFISVSAMENGRLMSGRFFQSPGNGVLDDTKERKNSIGRMNSRRISEAYVSRGVTPDETSRSPYRSSPTLNRPFMERALQRSSTTSSEDRAVGRRKVGWLRRLGIVACVVNRQLEEEDSVPSTSDESVGRKANRVRVHQCGKQFKELSAVYMGQDIKAHEGAISTMKFSPDGRYLSTGGEDGIVRVWEVMECDFLGERDLPTEDPCCIYFTANHTFDLDPTPKSKDRLKPGVLSRSSEAACIIIPPKVFQISEKPIHEFRGHKGEVLDLSWSKNKCLISSSVDKSVRLWKVGCDECIKCFHHNDYVTCVQFSPIDENFFISGSLDCKVRLWDISDCHVISWNDVKEMVTAVCYQPDGKGVVVGSMGGNCNFYRISDDNHLLLNKRICLQSKKKYHSKRITGLQYSPCDPGKLIVTSADSQVKVLDGFDVVCKYKGLRNASSQISASFTADGKYIISASEDSNVHIWSYSNQHLPPKATRVRSIRSREHFFSRDVSVAIAWQSPRSKERLTMAPDVFSSQHESSRDMKRDFDKLGKNSCRFPLNQRFFMELLPRGSATWPEEKLPSISTASSPVLSKSDYKFLSSCCEKALASHAWGRVIVTAGLDGRIRSFCNYGLPVGC